MRVGEEGTSRQEADPSEELLLNNANQTVVARRRTSNTIFSLLCACFQPVDEDTQLHVEKLKPLYLEQKEPIFVRLLCPSCEQIYMDPKMLPCAHSLCGVCLYRLRNETTPDEAGHYTVRCVVCKKSWFFKSYDDILFPNNYLLSNVIKRIVQQNGNVNWRRYPQNMAAYQNVDEGKISSQAEIENRYVLKDVGYLQSTEAHTTNTLIPSLEETDTFSTCFNHPDLILSLFSMNDKTPICTECKAADCQYHKVVPLDEAYKKETAILFDSITDFGIVKQERESNMLMLSNLIVRMGNHKMELKKKVHEGFTKLHNQLQRQEVQTLEVLEKQTLAKQESIQKYLASASTQLFNLQGLIEYSKEALKESNQAAFLQSADSLIEEIKKNVLEIEMPAQGLTQDPFENFLVDFDSVLMKICSIFSNFLQLKALDDKIVLASKPHIVDNTQTVTKDAESAGSKTSFLNADQKYAHPSGSAVSLEHNERSSMIIEKRKIHLDARSRSSPPISETHDRKEQKRRADLRFSDSSVRFNDEENLAAASSEGFTSANMDLQVPQPPIICQHSVDQKIVKISWMVSDTDMVDFFDLKFQAIISKDSHTMIPQDFSGLFSEVMDSSFEVSSLTPGSEYLFRVRGVNKAGEGKWSQPYKVVIGEEHKKRDRKQKTSQQQ